MIPLFISSGSIPTRTPIKVSRLPTNPKIIINSSDNASPYILNISIPQISGETIVHMLESNDIYVSTGSSCSSKLVKPEKTVYAITHNEQYAKSTIRISLSFLTTKEEIDSLAKILNTL